MKVGIIGCGVIARAHGPSILKQKDSQIVGVADNDQVRADALARELNVGHVYQDAAQMIDERKPDVTSCYAEDRVPEYQVSCRRINMGNRGCHRTKVC